MARDQSCKPVQFLLTFSGKLSSEHQYFRNYWSPLTLLTAFICIFSPNALPRSVRNTKTQPPPRKIPARQELPSPEHYVQMVLNIPRGGMPRWFWTSPGKESPQPLFGQAAPALSYSSALSGVPDPLGLLAPEVSISWRERLIPSSFSPAGRQRLGGAVVTQQRSGEKGLGRDFSQRIVLWGKTKR